MQLERLILVGSHVSKCLNLNICGTKRDVAPKQRYDKFPSVGDHIHAIPTFDHAWATPRHIVKEVLRNLRSSI